MEGVKVSIDRIVVDFTNVYWNFFNPFRQRICEYYNTRYWTRDEGFKYHVHIKDGGHWLHISYQLAYAPKSIKHTLRVECPPDSLIYFQQLLMLIKEKATDMLYVRSDVAFDIPVPLSELFALSLTGRNMHMWKGTLYSNQRHQRQVNGYCRVYNKKLQLLQEYGEIIEGDLTRFEIVYKPDVKIPLDVLVQYPPEFNRLYLCAQVKGQEQFKPKLWKRVQEMMYGELEQNKLSYYYRKQIEGEMRKLPILNFDSVAVEQWENAVTLPCAILGGIVSKVPVAQ